MADTSVPNNTTVVCAECGRIATDMCPTPPDGHLLCLCRPCDRLWRVQVTA